MDFPRAATSDLTTTPAPAVTITTEKRVTSTSVATPQPTFTNTVASCSSENSSFIREVEELRREVAQVRGIPFSKAVEVIPLDAATFEDQLEEADPAQYPEEIARKTEILYSMLDLMDEETDLTSLYQNLLLEQTAGFFDPHNNQVFIVCNDELAGMKRMILVRELTRALQEQTFGLSRLPGSSEAICGESYDACLAAMALSAGDASLAQEQWMRTFASPEDNEEVQAFFSTFEMPMFNQSPRMIQEEILFPAAYGLNFVRGFFLKGGWAAVDALYNEPPSTSEQILHPKRYPKDQPLSIELSELPEGIAGDWDEIGRGELGEWRILIWLEDELPGDLSGVSAEGWGGDYYQLLEHRSTGDRILIVVVVWDTMRDAHEFASGFIQFGDLHYGEASSKSVSQARWESGDRNIFFERRSNQSVFIDAPDPDVLELLIEEYSFPVRWSK